MQNLAILNKKETKKILEIIKEQWNCDVKELSNFVLMKNNKDKYYVINKEVFEFPLDNLRISKLGMYFGELHNGEFRLSIEGSQLAGRTAKKNVVELSDAEIGKWIRGEDVELSLDSGVSGFVLIKNNNDFYGCGKYKLAEKKLLNYYPKIRRIK